MKNKASAILKQIIRALASMAKAKTLAFKAKTRAIKARLLIFSLLSNRKFLMTSFSHKVQSLTGHRHRHRHRQLHPHEKEDNDQDDIKAMTVCNHSRASSHDFLPDPTYTHFIDNNEADDGAGEDEINEKIKCDNSPDSMHSLSETEHVDFKDPGGSVIDMVKSSKEQEGQEFRLEDEIDRLADMFISKFHCQMRMQKQLSLKRYQGT